MVAKVIWCHNEGSSSLKFALYQIADGDEIALAQGAVERNGLDTRLWINSAGQRIEKTLKDVTSPSEVLHQATNELDRFKLPHPDGVGHRIVHGGPNHRAPARITESLIQKLRGLIPFAPLHLPDEIAGIEAVSSRFPNVPQVACFDTAFHRSMPEVAQRFPLPRTLW